MKIVNEGGTRLENQLRISAPSISDLDLDLYRAPNHGGKTKKTSEPHT